MIVLGLTIALAAPLSASAAPKYTDWSTPVNMGSTVNSAAADQGPALSKDGLTLYITSQRSGGYGGNDIWVSQRESTGDAWGSPVNLGSTVNTNASDGAPSFSRDGHWMFFNSDRTGGFGALDVWASYRQDKHDDFAWETPVNLGSNINTNATDAGATYFANDDGDAPLLYFSSVRSTGVGMLDVYVSTLQADGSWGSADLVEELSSTGADNRPNIRFDGLEIIVSSNRAGGLGNFDLWVSTRNSTSSEWSTPENLDAPVNSAQNDQQSFISDDRETVIFASTRAGGSGSFDLYQSTRSKSNK